MAISPTDSRSGDLYVGRPVIRTRRIATVLNQRNLQGATIEVAYAQDLGNPHQSERMWIQENEVLLSQVNARILESAPYAPYSTEWWGGNSKGV